MADRSTTTADVAAALRMIADMLEAGHIADVAYVAVPLDGAPLQGLVVPPVRRDDLRNALYEVAAWAGNDLPNAAMQASDERLGAMSTPKLIDPVDAAIAAMQKMEAFHG